MAESNLITEWHNISTAVPTISINGILFQDILSILKKIYDRECVENWELFKDELFDHVVNQNNPHKVTIEQLKTSIIDYLYNVWLQNGFSGSKEDFIIMLFKFIRLTGNYEDIIKGTDEELVPLLKALHDYITWHDTSITGIHEDLLNSIFISANIEKEPAPLIALYKYIGIPRDIKEKLNKTTNKFTDINLHDGFSSGTEFSIKVESKFIDIDFFNLKNDLSIFKATLNTKNKIITLTIGNSSTDLDLSSLIEDIADNTPTKIVFILTLDNTVINCYCNLSCIIDDVLYQSNYKKWEITTTTVPSYKTIDIPNIDSSSDTDMIVFEYNTFKFDELFIQQIFSQYI